MDVCFGNRGIGKTTYLIRKAACTNGIVVAASKELVYNNCERTGIFVDSMDYEEFVELLKSNKDIDRPVYIDDIEVFLQILNENIKGFTVDIAERD